MAIRKANHHDVKALAEIIRVSYKTVAQRFNLTSDNCPKHPSNCTTEWIERDITRGVIYYILESNQQPVGCMGLEVANEKTCYLERLAVVPEKRNQGVGLKLLQYFIEEAKLSGFEKIGIGIIAKQSDLKSWYQRKGFKETGRKSYPHLPFEVAFMEYHISV